MLLQIPSTKHSSQFQRGKDSFYRQRRNSIRQQSKRRGAYQDNQKRSDTQTDETRSVKQTFILKLDEDLYVNSYPDAKLTLAS